MSGATRRGILAGIAAAVPAAASPDHDIIALAAELKREQGKLDAWDVDAIHLTVDQADAIHDVVASAAGRLMKMRPTTTAGLRAKAEAFRLVFRSFVVQDIAGTMEEEGEFHEQLAWSLMNDLVGRTST